MGFLRGLAVIVIRTLILISLTALGIALTLDQTLLNPYFLMTEFNKLDLSSIAEEMMSAQGIVGQKAGQPSQEATIIKNTIVDLQPWMKEQAASVIIGSEDYLNGKISSLDITVPLKTVKQYLIVNTQKTFLKNPPAELSPSEVMAYTEEYATQLITPIPDILVINENLLGTKLMSVIKTIRPFTSSMQLVLVGLFLLTVLLVILFCVIRSSAERSYRTLGVTFLSIGVIGYSCTFLLRFAPYFVESAAGGFAMLNIWLTQVIIDFSEPALNFGLSLAVIGAVFILFSIVYREGHSKGINE